MTPQEIQQLTKLDITENQIKVIKDKYLKNSPTIESWLRTVCHNMALGEVIHSENIPEEEIFKEVSYEKIPYKSKGKTFGMFLLHNNLKDKDEKNQNFSKFLENLELISKNNPEIISETEEKFYELLSSFKFLPNSPTLMNAGRELQQLSACYVLPVEDSIEGIYSSVKNMALIHQSGGGTGFSFSRLRPEGDVVKSTEGVSSGPVSFMQIFDKSTDVVKQGGTRRGANMGILHYTHPDILKFIEMKKTPGMMENFNISVTVDKKFMDAVEKNEEYELINPKNNKIVGKLNAKKVWDKLVEGAWETGDPGIIFIDRINKTGSNATPHLGRIEATNPCVAKGTLVNTPFGYSPVEKLKEGDLISTVFGKEPIKSIEVHENVPVFKVKFSDGGEQVVTAAHRYFVIKNGSHSKNLKDFRLDELETGDYVRVEPTKIKQNSPKKYLYGLKRGILLGDGCFTQNSYEKNFVKIASNIEDKGYNNNVKKLFSEFNFRKDDPDANSKSVNMIIGNGRSVLQTLDLTPSYSYEKTFDVAQVNTFSEAFGILDGLLATDGDILLKSNHPQIRFTTSSGALAQNIRRLLLMVGCHGRITQSFFDDGGIINGRKIKRKNFKYSICVSGSSAGIYASKSMLSKIHPEKGKKLKRIIKNWMTTGNTWKAKILSIEPAGTAKVYDLYCEESDTWITDGYVQRGCGEQPLLPYEPCNLGSINLSKFIKEPFTENADFDYEELKKCVSTCTHLLDNVIDVNNYPIPEIEKMAKTNRRIGLGVMGWAESLVKLGLAYGSPEALKKAEEVMQFINVSCMKASEKLAEERGVFPSWKGSTYDKNSSHFRGQEHFPRHSARTTIAPTGTIGIAAGLQGAGIEPFFAIVYTRYNAKGLDALREGKEPNENDTFFEVNPLFNKIAEENNYFGLEKNELYKKINDNHKSVKGIKEIPEKIQRLFYNSHDLTPKEHILMQCAFQKHTDNAVSKTVNLKNKATVKDVEEVYFLAYKNGAKGVTIYRDGSKQFQVLNIKDKEKGEKDVKDISDTAIVVPPLAPSVKLRQTTPYGNIHMQVIVNPKKGYVPIEVFAQLGNAGSEELASMEALGRLTSLWLRKRQPIEEVIAQLKDIGSGTGIATRDGGVHSLPMGFARGLMKFVTAKEMFGVEKLLLGEVDYEEVENKISDYLRTGKGPFDSKKLPEETIFLNGNGNNKQYFSEKCPDCGSPLAMEEGCQKCYSCGYSKC